MTAIRESYAGWVIRCDGCDRRHGGFANYASEAIATAEAARHGWTRAHAAHTGYPFDYCPTCVARQA